MKNINEIEIFKNNKKPLKNLSYDESEYMTKSSLEAIDFDKVKDDHCRTLRLSEVPKSCDALYQGDEIYFIEFKNGSMSNVRIYEIQKKIYDSIFIFMELTGFKIADIRERVNFILVYNKSKVETYLGKSREIQESESYNKILRTMSGLAKINISKFKLRQFEKYLVKNIYTYTQEEFDENFIKKYTTIKY